MSCQAIEGIEGTGIPPHLINLIEGLDENSKSRVRWGWEKTETFKPRRGTRQGCLISSDLFNLMAELLIRLALEGYTDGVKIERNRLTNLRYADDIIVIAGITKSGWSSSVRSTEMGLRINVKKTAVPVMSLNTSEEPEIEMYDERIPIVKTFKYLGVSWGDRCGKVSSTTQPGICEIGSNEASPKARGHTSSTQREAHPSSCVSSRHVWLWSLESVEGWVLQVESIWDKSIPACSRDQLWWENVDARGIRARRAVCEAMIERAVRTRKMHYFGHMVAYGRTPWRIP